MMGSLIQIRSSQLVLRCMNCSAHERVYPDGVDFIERQPVMNFPFIALKYSTGIALEEADEPAVSPAVIYQRKMKRRLIVRQRHHRLNTILPAFIEYLVIVGKPCFIRFFIIAIREDAAPGNRKTENLKAHLCK